MATAIATVPRPRARWNTLQTLRALRGVVLVLHAFVLITLLSFAFEEKTVLHAMEADVAPAILAADHVRLAMAEMESAAARELSPERVGSLQRSREAYAAHRSEAVRAILDAAEETRERVGEQRDSIESLQLGLGNFETTLQRARDLASTDRRSAVEAFRSAETVMDRDLQPAAETLDRTASEHLAQLLTAEAERTRIERALLSAGLLLLVGTLVFVQITLTQRTRRVLNLALVAANILVLLFGVHVVTLAGRLQAQLTSPVQAAFDSAHTLELARVYGALSDADRSSSTLSRDTPSAQARLRSEADADRVATLAPAMTGEQLLAALREGRAVEGFSGLLAAAAMHPVNAAQREAVLDSIRAWHGVRAPASARVQGSATAGGKIVPETDPYMDFEGSLSHATSLAEEPFLAATRAVNAGLGTLQTEAVLGTLGGVLLVLLGFAPRIREYRR